MVLQVVFFQLHCELESLQSYLDQFHPAANSDQHLLFDPYIRFDEQLCFSGPNALIHSKIESNNA